ncbi:MAG: methyltransferase domain-containing protein [Nitrososphaerota archaeon]
MKIVKNRAEPILSFIKGKDVLEIGCVGMGKHDTIGGKNFIAGYVMPISRKWVGVDINEKGVAKLRKMGFNALVIDVEKPFNLKQKFDIILAEEVLEHLSNLPTFFENVKMHLKEDGLLIITTPNPISPPFFIQRLFGGKIKDISVDSHMFWQTHETLINLLKKHSFKVIYVEYIHPEPAEPPIYYPFVKLLWKIVPSIFGRNLLVIAKKEEKR